MADAPSGDAGGRRLMVRVGATFFALLVGIYWGIGLNFTLAYALLNEAQRELTLIEYLWEVPVIGIPLGVVIPLLMLRPVARDYDRMLRGEAVEDPARSVERLNRLPRRIVWYFTPASIGAYIVGNLQSLAYTQIPIEEFWKGVPLGFPLGLLISLAAYLALDHYLEPVRRLFVLRHGHVPVRPSTTIYRKVVITSVTIVALSLALLWLIAFAQGQVLLEDQLHARMKESVLPAAVAVALHPESPYFEENLQRVALGERGYVFVVDPQGRVTGGHPRGLASLADEGWDEAQRGAILGGGFGRFTDRVSTVRLVAFTQVPGTPNHVVAVTYRDDFSEPLVTMSVAMLGATVLGLGVAVALTLTGARAITRPVRELTEAMRRARDDGTGGEAALLTDDEVGQLASSYAAMMARLREKTQALQDSVARLREMDALKTRFINIASHELRTPMTPIRTELHLLRRGKRGPLSAEQERGLDMVARNVERLNRLIRDLLDASRIQAGSFRLRSAPVAVPELVEGVLATMQGEATLKGVALDAELDVPGGIEVLADADRLAQVLINLLENAIQFTPSGGSVRVLVRLDGEAVLFEVRDTGIGIEPGVLARLFHPFSQAEPGVPRTEGGTGLGLFICKGIVEGHGGRIWCASEGRGKGASFLFTVPVRRHAPGALAEAPPGAAGVEPFGGPAPASPGAEPPRQVL